MEVNVGILNILGNNDIAENGLPKFRAKVQDKKLIDTGLLEEEKHLYGYQTGDRFLPYKLQDVYGRKQDNLEIKTIILENEYLKATFLPEYGMRLYSLYSKWEKRELLYVNDVFQMANLGIRQAWFSGGIEWNIGQLGHTFSTCDDLYVGVCKDDTDKEFIRAYEYERCKGVYWSIDFHLKEKNLVAYVRIVNPKKEEVPMYWWSNIAVREEKKARIFSGTDEVIYIRTSSNESQNAVKGMSHGKLPIIDEIPDKDATYPANIDFSSEYFFQNKNMLDQTWEAVTYNDGNVFYERSSKELNYRKMFCWGMHNGGKRWKEYLSPNSKESYVEIQAGLAPTQVHGLIMPANTQWDFVQIFGGFHTDNCNLYKEYLLGKDELYGEIQSQINDKMVDQYHTECKQYGEINPIKTLHDGSGYGVIEEKLHPGITPKGFVFSENSLTGENILWLNLIVNGQMVDIDPLSLPQSYIVDMAYEDLLKKAAEKNSYTACNHLGIMYYENDMDERAIEYFKKSLEIKENPLSLRNLHVIFRDTDIQKACDYMERAMLLLGESAQREYVEEYIDLLIATEQYETCWSYYCNTPTHISEVERIQVQMIDVAIHLQKVEYIVDMYKKEFSIIREGERGYSEGYFVYQAFLHAQALGEQITDELISYYRTKNDIPVEFDFRLTVK